MRPVHITYQHNMLVLALHPLDLLLGVIVNYDSVSHILILLSLGVSGVCSESEEHR